jgi:hypothetical protein
MLMAERERPLVDDLRRWDRGLQNRLRAPEIPALPGSRDIGLETSP